MGGLIIGMMTRTARGHTARPLRADRFDTACYVLVLLAAVVRVGLPLVAPAQTLAAVLMLGGPVVGRLRPVRRPLLAGAVAAAAGRPAGMSMDYSAVKLVHQSRGDAVGRRASSFAERLSLSGATGCAARAAKTLPACGRHRAAAVGADAGLDAAAHARAMRPGCWRRSSDWSSTSGSASSPCGPDGRLRFARRPGSPRWRPWAGSSRSPSRRSPRGFFSMLL